jgi:hypothetical protein
MFTVSTNRSHTIYGYDTKDEALAHASGCAANGGVATVLNEGTGNKVVFRLIDGVVKYHVITK